jgi:hypothetical protein
MDGWGTRRRERSFFKSYVLLSPLKMARESIGYVINEIKE